MYQIVTSETFATIHLYTFYAAIYLTLLIAVAKMIGLLFGKQIRMFAEKYIYQHAEDTNIPDPCFSCNRGHCHGCALEGLAREQASGIMQQMTKKAVEDGAIPYLKRFEK
jgi:hypothetical protein